jgi:hypothetical protein
LEVDRAGLPPLARLRDRRLIEAPLRLTPTGEAVVAGRDDWFRLNGAARWVGGVHLIGPDPAWRWDADRRRVVAAV